MIGVPVPFNETRWVFDHQNIQLGGKPVIGNWISSEMHEWLEDQYGMGTRIFGNCLMVEDWLSGVHWGYHPPQKTMWFHNPKEALFFKLAWGGR